MEIIAMLAAEWGGDADLLTHYALLCGKLEDTNTDYQQSDEVLERKTGDR